MLVWLDCGVTQIAEEVNCLRSLYRENAEVVRNLIVIINGHRGNVGTDYERYSPKPCIVRNGGSVVSLAVLEVAAT